MNRCVYESKSSLVVVSLRRGAAFEISPSGERGFWFFFSFLGQPFASQVDLKVTQVSGCPCNAIKPDCRG